MGIEARDRRARIGFGIANLAVALFVVGGVFRLLPTRWWLIDVAAVLVAMLLGSSGVALLAKASAAETLTRLASGLVLVIGLALFAAIVTTAGWIGGVYGQVGTSGAIIFGLVAALVLPYVVVLPAAELAWIGPRAKREEWRRDPSVDVPESVSDAARAHEEGSGASTDTEKPRAVTRSSSTGSAKGSAKAKAKAKAKEEKRRRR